MRIADAIRGLIEDGVSLIPIKTGTKEPAGRRKWKEADRLSYIDLMDLFVRFDTNSVAMIMGVPSGNMICIDIDTKHKKGFDAIIFKDIRELYPELWERLRVEKTPSGGYHILYRIDLKEGQECPRSGNVASRFATDEDLKVRPDLKKYCFLEVKGNGGLSHCFPTDGYIAVKDVHIPKLTIEEHSSLFELCRTYNECVAVERVKTNKKESDFFSTNPYEDFDASMAGGLILEEAGWNIIKSVGEHTYYSKPGRKTKEVSASFTEGKNIFTIWTTGTNVDAKSYSPSNLLCHMSFDNDKGKLFSYLVGLGYGKIKPSIEKSLIERASTNTNAVLPENISPEGLAKYEELKERFKEQYPYGTFWEVNKEGNWNINRENLGNVCYGLGLRMHNQGVCRIDGYFIEKVTERYFIDIVKGYIVEDNVDIFHAYEAFMQKSVTYTITRLKEIEPELVMRSSKLLSYKFYKNCYVEVDKDRIEIKNYTENGLLIWREDVKDRNFYLDSEWEKGLYWDYLNKAIGISSYLKKCMGYYAHDHRDEEGYFVVATESCENPKDGGGSGKNIFWNLFRLITTYKSTAASMIKRDNQLLQSWNGEKVFILADMPKSFDLVFFKEIITGNAVVRKLYKDEYDVPIEDMCKIGGSSNFSFDDTDPGVKRRVRALEFTDFFTKKGGVHEHYGKMFPMDWDSQEFLWFDNFMMVCIQEYLKGNSKLPLNSLTESGWNKKYEQKFGHLFDWIKDNIEKWLDYGFVDSNKFALDYKYYVEENGISKRFSPMRINEAVSEYCEHFDIGFERNIQRKIDNINHKGKEFSRTKDTILLTDSEIEFSPIQDDDVPF